MEKNKLKAVNLKKVAFCNNVIQGLGIDCDNTQIRLGISFADEKAKQEMQQMRINAPLTTEEKLFSGKK